MAAALPGVVAGLGAMAARDVASFGLYIALYERANWELRRRTGVSRRGAGRWSR